MELRVSHEQSLSSSTPVVDNIFDKYNKNLVPIRSLSDHDILPSKWHHVLIDVPFLQQRTKNEPGSYVQIQRIMKSPLFRTYISLSKIQYIPGLSLQPDLETSRKYQPIWLKYQVNS